jgi:hypothetical protein
MGLGSLEKDASAPCARAIVSLRPTSQRPRRDSGRSNGAQCTGEAEAEAEEEEEEEEEVVVVVEGWEDSRRPTEGMRIRRRREASCRMRSRECPWEETRAGMRSGRYGISTGGRSFTCAAEEAGGDGGVGERAVLPSAPPPPPCCK